MRTFVPAITLLSYLLPCAHTVALPGSASASTTYSDASVSLSASQSFSYFSTVTSPSASSSASSTSPSSEASSTFPFLSSTSSSIESSSLVSIATSLPSSVTSTDSITTTQSSSASAPSTTSEASAPTETLDPGTLADIATIRERRLADILHGATKISQIPSWLRTLGADGKWPDAEIDYTAGCEGRRANWPAQDHWKRIVPMAAAWHGGAKGGENFVSDPSVLDAISRAMDYWFANDFTNLACLTKGDSDACPCGTPGLWNTNWFSNVIGIPELVGQACLLVGRDTLTPTQVGNCTNMLGRTFGTFDTFKSITGANTLDVASISILSGLLVDNASMIAESYERIHREVVVQNTTKGDGIRADGSFSQHAGIIYNGNYGKDYTNGVLTLEIAGAGTQFSASNSSKESQAAFEKLLDGNQWMIYRNVLTGVLHWDFSVLSRIISFPVADTQATANLKMNLTQIDELGKLWDSEVLRSVHKSLNSTSEDANAGHIIGNRMFFANDYMVTRGSGYVSTLRMFSSRTKNTECTNAQNPFGFHLSDGTLYTYLQGNEYEDIVAAWDWNMIPGTTTDYGATNLSCDQAKFNGIEPFVGGASDGKVVAAAMRYTNPSTGSLSFQKAWFFLDDDVQHIMISHAASNASEAHPVISVLDQKRVNGEVYIDGRALDQGGNFSHPYSLWHDGVGYAFEHGRRGVELSVDFGARSGNWADIGISTVGEITVDLFSAWINHGTGSDLDVPTSYTVYPATSLEEFQKKGRKSKVKTVRNDQDVSAVYDGTYNVAMIVFWKTQGGEVTFSPSWTSAPITISASANSVVLYRIDEGTVTVSDPSQLLESVDLTFKVGLLGSRPNGWGQERVKTLNVTLPVEGLAGQSVSLKL